jgi:flagellar motor protein MotB
MVREVWCRKFLFTALISLILSCAGVSPSFASGTASPSPSSVSTAGGTTITISLGGVNPTNKVFVIYNGAGQFCTNSQPITVDGSFAGGNASVSCTVPPNSAGSVSLAVWNSSDGSTLTSAFASFSLTYFNPVTTPNAPTIISATPSNGQISIAFSDPSNDGGATITDYEYTTNGGTNWKSTGSTSSPLAISTTSTNTSLVNGTSYTIQIRAKNSAGSGTASNSSSATPRTVPGSPTIGTATKTDSTTVTVDFLRPVSDGGDTITAYVVTATSSSTPPGRTVTETRTVTVLPTTDSVTVTGLSPAKSYTFTVRARNAAGLSVASAASGSVTTDPIPPSSPETVTATAKQDTISIISWGVPGSPDSDGGSPVLDYSVTSSPAVTPPAGCTNTTNRSCTFEGLTNGTTYTFSVKARNAIGLGSAETATAKPGRIPSPPISLVATPSNETITVSFTAGSDGGYSITKYQYSYETSTTNSGPWSLPSSWTDGGSTSPVRVTGLTNGTFYRVYLRAVNDVGNGETSTSVISKPRTVPNAPTIGTVSRVDSTTVTVSFTPPTNDGGATISGYTVTSSPDGVTASGSESPITIGGLKGGVTYTFSVKANNEAGSSSASSSTSGYTTDAIPPDVPTSFAATSNENGQSVLSWGAPSVTGGSAIETYTVTSSPTSSGCTTTVSTRTCTITGLTNGTLYTFTVKARNAVGEGEGASATATPSTVPSAPTALVATPGNGQVSVAFAAGANGGSAITNYQYSTDDGLTWKNRTSGTTASPILINSVSSSSTSLQNGFTYTIRLRAVNASSSLSSFGESSTAVTATPRTVPGAPTIGTATRTDSTTVTVTFTSNADGGSPITGYTVASTPGGLTATGTSSPITISGLQPVTTYQFSVTATNAAGTGNASALSTSVTTLAIPPGAPGNVRATSGVDGQSVITWETPTVTGGSSIETYTVTSSPTSSGCTTPTSTLTCTITGLTNGTLYTFTVKARNAIGEGTGATATATPSIPVVTPAPTPTPGPGPGPTVPRPKTQAELDEEKKKQEEEAAANKKKQEEEAANKKKQEEEAANKKKQEEEEAANKKKQEEEAANKKKQEEEAANKRIDNVTITEDITPGGGTGGGTGSGTDGGAGGSTGGGGGSGTNASSSSGIFGDFEMSGRPRPDVIRYKLDGLGSDVGVKVSSTTKGATVRIVNGFIEVTFLPGFSGEVKTLVTFTSGGVTKTREIISKVSPAPIPAARILITPSIKATSTGLSTTIKSTLLTELTPSATSYALFQNCKQVLELPASKADSTNCFDIVSSFKITDKLFITALGRDKTMSTSTPVQIFINEKDVVKVSFANRSKIMNKADSAKIEALIKVADSLGAQTISLNVSTGRLLSQKTINQQISAVVNAIARSTTNPIQIVSKVIGKSNSTSIGIGISSLGWIEDVGVVGTQKPLQVKFKRGSSTLTSSTKNALRTYALSLTRSGVKGLAVAGFSDTPGVPSALSQSRALAVSSFLKTVAPKLTVAVRIGGQRVQQSSPALVSETQHSRLAILVPIPNSAQP